MSISVVIPCYNAEKYLEETISSILSQTVKPHEVILVNDGSTDKSVEIAEKHPEVTIYHNKKNMGIGYTRQRGLELATSDFLAFLSSDDCWHPHFLKRSIEKLSLRNGTYTDYYVCNSNLIPQKIYRSLNFSVNNVIDYALNKNMFVNFSSILFPNNKEIKFTTKMRHGEDLIFLLDSLIAGLTWIRVPEPLLYYRIHNEQGTKLKEYGEYKQLWKMIYDRLSLLGIDPQLIKNSYRDNHDKLFHHNTLIRFLLRFSPIPSKSAKEGPK